MNPPFEKQGSRFAKAASHLAALASQTGSPNFDTNGSRKLEAWFLGPKAENADEFLALVNEAIRDHAYWRRNYHPDDPTHITEAIKREPEYLDALGTMRDEFLRLLGFLKKSVPFFSMRYQGHMNWDLTIPGMLGYFAAMLYNPNNVALEGSTATTLLELLVGDDLCRMLGYTIPTEAEALEGAIRPWGHVTCDGTVANIEALWAARNLKFFPIAFSEAVKNDPALANARKFRVALPTGGDSPLVELTVWQLLNLNPDVVLDLPRRLRAEFNLDARVIDDAVGNTTCSNSAWAGSFGPSWEASNVTQPSLSPAHAITLFRKRLRFLVWAVPTSLTSLSISTPAWTWRPSACAWTIA